jgi:DNA-binding CsgD family transcriptional regulator
MLEVLDPWLEPLLRNRGAVGELALEVAPGPYQIRARIADTEITQLVIVRPGDSTQIDMPVQFDAAAPVEGTKTRNETHGYLAEGLTATTTGQPSTAVPSRSSSFVLILRGLFRRVMAPLPNTGAPFELFDQRGRPIQLPTPKPAREAAGQPTRAIGWAMPLQPGGYRLRWERPSEQPVEHAIWLSPGWQTVLFVPQGAHGPSLPEMSVHLVRTGTPWKSYVPGALAVEAALAALRESTASTVDPRAADFVTDANNPMLALLTLHILGRARRAGALGGDADDQRWARRAATGIRQLRRSLGRHPDVMALAAQWPMSSQSQRPLQVPAPWPPLLADSLDLLLAAGTNRPDVVPADSLTEAVSGQRYASNPWLLWDPSGLPLKPRPRPATLTPVAVARVQDLLRGVAQVLQLQPAEAAQRVGAQEIARRLGMSGRLVERCTDAALTNLQHAERTTTAKYPTARTTKQPEEATLTDDLDGSKNAQTVTFGLDGVSYEINLSPQNRVRMEQIVAPFIDVARQVPYVSHRRRRRTRSRVPAAVRAWPKEPGLTVSERDWTSLTPREQQVADLVASGLSTKEVATQLHLSPATVKAHLSQLLRKLGVSSRTQLAQRLGTRA